MQFIANVCTVDRTVSIKWHSVIVVVVIVNDALEMQFSTCIRLGNHGFELQNYNCYTRIQHCCNNNNADEHCVENSKLRRMKISKDTRCCSNVCVFV